jgi:hypothetical protein
VTDHAVERFIQRWRPGTPIAEARAYLEELAARAAATKRRTLVGDARVYTVMTDDGEHIELAVRDNVVVTVLDANAREAAAAKRIPEDQASFIEARDEEEALKAARLAMERAKAQQVSAERTIAEWKAGASVSKKVLERARTVLGLHDQQLSRLRIEGGDYDGVCIEVRAGDGIEETIERLREAMKGRRP